MGRETFLKVHSSSRKREKGVDEGRRGKKESREKRKKKEKRERERVKLTACCESDDWTQSCN